jgi:hypothetical protein
MPPAQGYRFDKDKKQELAEERAEPAKVGAIAPVGSAYLTKLGMLARELDAAARRADAGAIRILRQRLTEWVEDLRSVGGQAELADAVEHLVQRLAAALALATDLATETIAVSAELAKLATGTPPPRKQGRVAFWK